MPLRISVRQGRERKSSKLGRGQGALGLDGEGGVE